MLRGSQGKTHCYAFLDGGSTTTILDANTARLIGLTGPRLKLKISGITNFRGVECDCEKVDFEIIGALGSYQATNVITMENLVLPAQTLCSEEIAEEPLAVKMGVRAYFDVRPKLLIGQDYARLIEPTEVRPFSREGYLLSCTKLGWVVHGPGERRAKTRGAGVHLATSADGTGQDGESVSNEVTNEQLDSLIRQQFTLDSLCVGKGATPDAENDRAWRTLEETTCRIGNAWQTGLLWKSEQALPESRKVAEQRFASLERRFRREPQYAALYHKEFERFFAAGYVEVDRHQDESSRSWYLPHFCIVNPNRPNKARLVFDAASRSRGYCLNDFLDNGPVQVQSLLGILMRFREGKVAVKGDISDMFLRVLMRPDDQCAQRFLWRDNRHGGKLVVYVVTRLMFGARPSPASAIYVRDRNAKEAEISYPDSAARIIRNSYIDDFFDSCDTEAEAKKLAEEVMEINSGGGFVMHDWASNYEHAVEGIPSGARAGGEIQCDQRGRLDGVEKALGLKWNTRSDQLSFNVSFARIQRRVLEPGYRPTKRAVLRIVMSIFYPLGLLAPFTVRAKILLREIWRSGTSWDEPLKDAEFDRWSCWLAELKQIDALCLPRHYLRGRTCPKSIELHTFSDASSQAYAAVCYWKMDFDDGVPETILIASKCRAAPLKSLTIPRLELQAAVLGAKLAAYVEREHRLRVDRRIFWCDSRTVLCWIQSNAKKYKTFVENRVAEIVRLSSPSEWRWVPTDQNAADLATREVSIIRGLSEKWFDGPTFVKQGEVAWPVQCQSNAPEPTEADSELTGAKVFVTSAHEADLTTMLPDAARYSSWNRLVRSTARALFVAPLRWKGDKEAQITTPLLRRAELLWWRKAQRDTFAEEIHALERGQTISSGSRLTQLCPYVGSDGCLRLTSRLPDRMDFDFNQVILDGRHPIARLMLAHYHVKALHGSREIVVNEILQVVWILGLRRALGSVVAKCQFCKLKRSQPRPPFMGQLPEARLSYGKRPFSQCGLDYFGPLMVSVGRRREKRWVALFTCLTTRAVHLEVAHYLTTDSAILAVRRMAARRGPPEIMWTDQGTNFKGACSELKDFMKTLDRRELHEYASEQRMQWRFIPPASPHMGGAWERMVRTVKVALCTVLKEQAPKEETLLTILAEVEHLVNSRPLTHIPVDPRDGEALTPNHFLLGSSSGRSVFDRFETASVASRRQWEIAQSMTNRFWKRWLNAYLPTIVLRKKWTEECPPIRVGEVVLIADNAAPRNVWRKGVVERVYVAADKRVRVADLRTSSGVLTRPVIKLIPLTESSEVQTSLHGGD